MSKDLTQSDIDRQNILNNPFALTEIQKAIKIQGIIFDRKLVFLKEQVADFFEVTTRTIENYLSKYNDELSTNGYEVLKGKRLSEFKLAVQEADVTEIDFGNKFFLSKVSFDKNYG